VNLNGRVKRPCLERTRPIRSWSKLLGAPAAADGASAGDAGPTPPGGGIARSVELGYRVIDDYIRQGRSVAERLGARTYGPEAVGADVQELGARMMRYASDFMAVWVQLMEVSVGGGARPAREARPPVPEAAGPVAAAATDGAPISMREPEGTRVRVEVASLWPTEVWLDLRPEAATASVVVHALRATDPEIPRLDDVSFANGPANDPPVLRVRIPPSQPPGVYNGLIIDRQTNRPVGTVSVRVARE
jgi:hypothetical protein